MNSTNRDIELMEVIKATLALPSSSRMQFLTERCGHDIALHEEAKKGINKYEQETSLNLLLPERLDRNPEGLIDQTIGQYQIVELLGTGGYGSVYKALDTRLENRLVALKILTSVQTSDEIQRFDREVKALSELNDDRIVKIFNKGSTKDKQYFIAMEYIVGENLRDFARSEPQLPISEILNLAGQIADALKVCHATHIIHRDLKPANIMIYGEKRNIKLIDFGIAKSAQPWSMTVEQFLNENSTAIGTPAYMSPEQLQGEKLDYRTDIWAFGAILFEMITGFRYEDSGANYAESAISYRSDCPSQLSAIVSRCLSRSQDTRPEIHEILSSIEKAKLLQSDKAGRQGSTKPFYSLIGLFALILIGIIAYTWYFTNDERGQTIGQDGTTICPGEAPTIPVFNFNPLTLANDNVPLCHDFPLIDLALDKNNPQFSTNYEELRSTRRFKTGDVIAVLLYLNNGAANNLPATKTTAMGVVVTTSLTRNENLYYIQAQFSADNAESKGDVVKVAIDPDQEIVVIPNSGFIYDYMGRPILDQQNLNLGNSDFPLNGVSAGWAYSLFMSYKLEVVKKSTA